MEGRLDVLLPRDPDAEDWVADHARTVLASRAVDAAATITRQADTGRFRGTERTGADQAVAYLRRKAPYLDYPTALAQGWQIATGIIEGAARFLIRTASRSPEPDGAWTPPKPSSPCAPSPPTATFHDYRRYHQQQQHHRTYPTTTTRTSLSLAA